MYQFKSTAIVLIFTIILIFECNGGSNKHCQHGQLTDNDYCTCDDGYVGDLCERPMHCATFARHDNGSCINCLTGWSGLNCDNIECGDHGDSSTTYRLVCICEKPYNGVHCDRLETANIYHYYNKKVFVLGPLGALSIIPLVAIFYGCEYMAKRRHVRRLEQAMEEQKLFGAVNSDVVDLLLKK